MDTRANTLRVSPTVVATEMPDGAVLINSATGDCFELNRLGTRIWERLSRGEAQDDITAALADQYSVERSVISRDIAALIDDLARHGILLTSR